MKTLHVVGYKNSGKTTLISRWVRLLKEKGFTVAVLKHHGHGGKPDMPDRKTDTMQFIANGADATLVAGGGAVQFVWNEEPDFVQLKQLARYGTPEVLLIEGYKAEVGEKVVFVRDEAEWETLRLVQGRQLVIGYAPMEIDCIHIHSREHVEQIDDWLMGWIGKGNDDETV